MRPLRSSLLAAAALSLLVTGCGGKSTPAATPSSAPPQTPAPVVHKPSTWPYTGLSVNGGDGSLDHPAYVVKVDNVPDATPQVGLSKADMVVEELVEGGVTRLAAFYYSQLPPVVGPIRSMRASDIGIVPHRDATIITSGAAAVTIKRINGAKLPFITEGDPSIFRDTGRYAPHNEFVKPPVAAKEHKLKKAIRPDDYLPWGTSLPNGKPARNITADFGNHATQWTYQKGLYVNTNGYMGTDKFPADSVLVMRVDVGLAGYLDPAGYPVPETHFVGKGAATLFHNGKAYQGTWSKKTLTSLLTLKAKGKEMNVPPGHVFIELVPAKTGNLTFTK